MSTRARQLGRGFTIVELMVVLGIIAVLIAILLPSLSRAREQANRTRCLNNIRQIGVGVAIYMHDFDDLPPIYPWADPSKARSGLNVAYYAESRSGLLALRETAGFERACLACPDGWASGGDADWYAARGLSPTGAAYMDYAYWATRFPPGEQYDVRAATFTYRAQEKRTKILVSDVVADEGSPTTSTLGHGNHASHHSGPSVIVPMTDGQRHRLPTVNKVRASGGSVLFADYHAEWFDVCRFTQQTTGLCYPPPDQW